MADNDGDSEKARSRRLLQAAARTYRVDSGPRAGQKVPTDDRDRIATEWLHPNVAN